MLKSILVGLSLMVLLCGCHSMESARNYFGHFQAEDGSELFISSDGIQFKSADPELKNKTYNANGLVADGWQSTFDSLNSNLTGVYMGPVHYMELQGSAPMGPSGFINSGAVLPESRNLEVLQESREYIDPDLIAVGAVFELNVKYEPTHGSVCPTYTGPGVALDFTVDTNINKPVQQFDAAFSGFEVHNTADETCFIGPSYEISTYGWNAGVYYRKLAFKRVE
jgi:hypothetical protein